MRRRGAGVRAAEIEIAIPGGGCVTAAWQAYENVVLSIGAENALSTEPPRVGNSQTDANTLVPLFDVLGARIFMGATAIF